MARSYGPWELDEIERALGKLFRLRVRIQGIVGVADGDWTDHQDRLTQVLGPECVRYAQGQRFVIEEPLVWSWCAGPERGSSMDVFVQDEPAAMMVALHFASAEIEECEQYGHAI